MKINGVACVFHHIGIPTTEPRPGERFDARFGLWTRDSPCAAMRVQWHRFEPDSPLHRLIQTVPYVAFKVDGLERAIEGRALLLGPYEPIAGYRVAIIEEGGQSIELVETGLNDEELWRRAVTRKPE